MYIVPPMTPEPFYVWLRVPTIFFKIVAGNNIVAVRDWCLQQVRKTSWNTILRGFDASSQIVSKICCV